MATIHKISMVGLDPCKMFEGELAPAEVLYQNLLQAPAQEGEVTVLVLQDGGSLQKVAVIYDPVNSQDIFRSKDLSQCYKDVLRDILHNFR